MTILKCDFDEDGSLFRAFQTLIFEVSELQKRATTYKVERDDLEGTVERLRSVLSSSDKSPENGARRKRTKTSTPPNDASACSLQDVTNDDLNAAFHSSICFDDDSIVGMQIGEKQTISRKSSDKENNSKFRLTNTSISHIDEKSPTLLNRYPMKMDSKLVTPDRLSSPVRRTGSKGSSTMKSKSSATKKGTPRRLFDVWGSPSTSKTSPTPPQKQPNVVSKRKFSHLSLSYSANTMRMKQSTINFPPKQSDDTFFESLSMQKNNAESKSVESSTINNIMNEHGESSNVQLHPSNSDEEEDDISRSLGDNSAIEVIKNTNEIINIDESESSQELYAYVHDIKRELDLPTQFDDSDNNKALISGPTRAHSAETHGGCPDCDMYHEMLGRDPRNPGAKYGVCSKHHRKSIFPETPPNFWNPKIIDTPEDELITTPFDSRFVKD